MTSAEIIAILASLLFAASIMPGTLGVLLMTSKIAAKEWGARLIYEKAIWGAAAGSGLMIIAWIMAAQGGGASTVMIGATLVYLGVAVFGFFMHTKFLFQPVTKPLYMSVDQAFEKFGPDEEVVGVIDDNGTAWAYVARLARRPHIVEQNEGSHPFMMTHCILAHSSMAFALEDKVARPDITITSALANNLVFYERNSKCSIVQAKNGSPEGELPLRMVPTIAVSLKTWKAMYPDSKVWYRTKEWRDEFYLRLLARADVIDPKSPVMVYPLVHGLDERRPMKSMVTGVEINRQSRIYTMEHSQANPLIHDTFADVDLLVASGYDNNLIQVFNREVEGKTLNFTPDGENRFIDTQTGSKWNLLGACSEGPMKGKKLTLIPHYNKMFWYVWADYHPGTEIYDPTVTAVAAE